LFSERVRNYFSYLENQYKFNIIRSENSDIRPQTDGVVEYKSDTIGVIIDSETGSAALRFYRTKDSDKFYLTPIDIFEYLSTNTKEKGLLLSTNPKDLASASTLFNQKNLLNQAGWKSENNLVLAKLELRLSNYAKWLKEHANLCIEGNFSEWPNFYEYK